MQIIDQGLRAVRDGLRMFTFDRLARDVDAGIYAATIRGILLHHIHVTKQVVTYGSLAQATTTLPKGGQLAQALQRIAEDDHQAKRPLSTAIVVNDHAHYPGAGFFKQARELGFQIEYGPDAETKFWEDQLKLLGVQGPERDFQREALKKVADTVGKDIQQDGEINILEQIWHAPKIPYEGTLARMLKSSPPLEYPHPSEMEAKVFSRTPPRPVAEVAAEVTAKQGFLLIPPRDLRVGDIVLNIYNDREVVVDSINTYTHVSSGTHRGRTAALTKDVHWTSGDESFLSPSVGIHFKVRRPEPPVSVIGRSENTTGLTMKASISKEFASEVLRVSGASLGFGPMPSGDAETLDRARRRKAPKKASKKSTKR